MQNLGRLMKSRFLNHGGSVMVCGAFGQRLYEIRRKLYGSCMFSEPEKENFDSEKRILERKEAVLICV